MYDHSDCCEKENRMTLPIFRDIATRLRQRGLYNLTPVSADGKRGVQKRWNYFQLRTPALIERYAGVGARHEFKNAAVVSHEGEDNLLFFDPDTSTALKDFEHRAGHKLPKGYSVCTRPVTDPERVHHYMRQTSSTVSMCQEYFRARARRRGEKFEGVKSINIKSLTEFNDEGGRLNLYDVKGIGKKSSL
jgi:hypothetical protein